MSTKTSDIRVLETARVSGKEVQLLELGSGYTGHPVPMYGASYAHIMRRLYRTRRGAEKEMQRLISVVKAISVLKAVQQ